MEILSYNENFIILNIQYLNVMGILLTDTHRLTRNLSLIFLKNKLCSLPEKGGSREGMSANCEGVFLICGDFSLNCGGLSALPNETQN
jgi:hypothetical protein